jgi:hypothetical protein
MCESGCSIWDHNVGLTSLATGSHKLVIKATSRMDEARHRCLIVVERGTVCYLHECSGSCALSACRTARTAAPQRSWTPRRVAYTHAYCT